MIHFPGMIMMKVDPFAVYRAERHLRVHDIRVPREVLVNHYLVMGQLETLTERLAAHTGQREGKWWKRLAAMDIKEHYRPKDVESVAYSHYNPLTQLFHPETFAKSPIKHPVAVAIWNSVVGTLFVAAAAVVLTVLVVAARDIVRALPFVSYRNLAYVEGGVIAACTAQAFLGAKIGAARASRILGIVFVIAGVNRLLHDAKLE